MVFDVTSTAPVADPNCAAFCTVMLDWKVLTAVRIWFRNGRDHTGVTQAGVAHDASPRQNVVADALVPLFNLLTGKLLVTCAPDKSTAAAVNFPPAVGLHRQAAREACDNAAIGINSCALKHRIGCNLERRNTSHLERGGGIGNRQRTGNICRSQN